MTPQQEEQVNTVEVEEEKVNTTTGHDGNVR